MLHINVTEVNTSLMSLSIITFALSSFSTSYSIINSVQDRIKKRISIAEGGVPYKLSKAYKYLKKANLFRRAKWNRIYDSFFGSFIGELFQDSPDTTEVA